MSLSSFFGESLPEVFSGTIVLYVATNGSSTPANPLTGQAFSSLSACITWCRQQSFAIDAKINISVEAGTYLNEEGFDFTGLPEIRIICPERQDLLIINGTTTVASLGTNSEAWSVTIPVTGSTASISVGQYVSICPIGSSDWNFTPLSNALQQELALLGCWEVIAKTANSISIRICKSNNSFAQLPVPVGTIANNRLRISVDPVSIRMAPEAQIVGRNTKITLDNLQIIGDETTSTNYEYSKPVFRLFYCEIYFNGCSFAGKSNLVATNYGGGWQILVFLVHCTVKTRNRWTGANGIPGRFTVFGGYDHNYSGYPNIVFSECSIVGGTNDSYNAAQMQFIFGANCFFVNTAMRELSVPIYFFVNGSLEAIRSQIDLSSHICHAYTGLIMNDSSIRYSGRFYAGQVDISRSSTLSIDGLFTLLNVGANGTVTSRDNSAISLKGGTAGSPTFSPAVNTPGNWNSIIRTTA